MKKKLSVALLLALGLLMVAVIILVGRLQNVPLVQPSLVVTGELTEAVASLPEVSMQSGVTSNSESEIELEVASYPGDVAYREYWTETVGNGFELGFNVTVWEPTKSTEAFAYPLNSDRIIDKIEGYDGAEAWVIPFALVASNETVGFGGFEADFCIGTTKAQSVQGAREPSNQGNPLIIKNDGKDLDFDGFSDGSAYVAMVGFFNDGSTDCRSVLIDRGEVREGGKRAIYGYLVFVDAKRTPSTPNGVGSDWFLAKSSRNATVNSVIISAGRGIGMNNYQCQKLISVNKDGDGNVVLGDEYEIYLR